MSTKKPQTNPFVYVIAAAVIAILALGLRFLVDALDANNSSIEAETEVKNYLAPKKQEETKAPAMTSTGTMTGTTTPSGAVAQ